MNNDNFMKIKMDDDRKADILNVILNSKNLNKQKRHKKMTLAIAVIVLLLLVNPITYTIAKEQITNWYYAIIVGDEEIVVDEGINTHLKFNENINREGCVYNTMFEVNQMLGVHVLSSNVYPVPVRYKPRIDEDTNAVTSVNLTSELYNHGLIEQDKLLTTFFNENAMSVDREQITKIYEGKADIDANSLFSNALHMSAYMNTNKVEGNSNAIASESLVESYISEKLQTKVVLHYVTRMYGTKMLYANFSKDDVQYTLSGYVSVEDMKQSLETLE